MNKVPHPIKILLAIAALIAVSFQGCSSKGFLTSSAFSGKANPGNGNGYEGHDLPSPSSGMVTVGMFLLYLEDGTCADQGPKSAIRYARGVYTLERFECEQILPAQPLEQSQVMIDTQDPLVLSYGGRIFRQR